MAAEVSKAFSFEFPIFNFLCGTRTSPVHVRQASQSFKLFDMLRLQHDPSIFRQRISSSSSSSSAFTLRFMSPTSNQHSFTVSYLIDKLGFSPESALKASNRLHLETSTNADTVISFLEEQGFSKSQIKAMIMREPLLLASKVKKTISPKLKYFFSKGFSVPDLTKLLSYNPQILGRSLERQIIPFFNAYSSLTLSDEKTIKAMRIYPRLISYDVDVINTRLLFNINVLRDRGVPESNINKMLCQFPGSLLIKPGSFKEIVEKVDEIGLDPLKLKFVLAVNVLTGMSKSIRESKVDAFKKWGWSEKEIWECFRKYPFCFAVSEDKLMAKMDFLVNKMGIESSLVANKPGVLRQSLEKRIIPRGLIAQHLLSKGLIEKDFSLSSLFDSSEEIFLKRFVEPHVDEAPELLKLYRANLKM